MDPVTIIGASIITALINAGAIAAPVAGAAIAAGPVATAATAAGGTAVAGSLAATGLGAGAIASNPWTAQGAQNAGAVAFNQAGTASADAYNGAAGAINGVLPAGVPPLPPANFGG